MFKLEKEIDLTLTKEAYLKALEYINMEIRYEDTNTSQQELLINKKRRLEQLVELCNNHIQSS